MKKLNIWVILAVIGVLMAGAVFLYRNSYLPNWGGYGGYHMGRGMPGHWGMGFLMPLFWILVIAWVVSLLTRQTSGTGRSVDEISPAADAVEILRQRYARGEIERTEFKSKLADLKSP